MNNNNRLAKTTVTTYTLKVLLVEFQDVHGDVNGKTYTRANFKNMLDGSNYTTTSPDSETVYGSMNQYYNNMTNGNVVINATVLNNTSGGDLPTWVRLLYNKNDYKNYSRDFFTDAYDAGVAEGYDLSTSSTTKLVYVYAGNYYGGGLIPMAPGNMYLMNEIWSGGYDNEGTVANGYTFSHIGIHCHEFGHTIGLNDIYGYGHGVDWSLMGDGCDMGNTTPHKGQCPAPIDPHQRYINNWVSVQTPSIPNTGLNLTYDGSNPTIYRIVSGSEVYYFENRRYQDYSRYCPDYGSYSGSGGILVWRTNGATSYPRVEIIEADGEQTWWGNFGDLWPGSSGNRNLNDFTTVNCKKDDETNSSIIMHSVSNPGTTMTAILGGKWFGDLPSSLTWSGETIVGGNLTIPSGLTLTINAGSFLAFDNGVGLTANGTLYATGNSSSRITFTCTSGTQGGIRFNSGSSGSVQYCNIYSTGTYGIQLNNSSPTISYNNITSGSVGIYCQYSNPILSHNTIIGQSSYGISCYDSDVYMANSGNGNNIIRQNGAGIAAGYGSTVFLSSQNNCVHNNTGYEIFASNNSVVSAENTWWNYTTSPYYNTNDFLIQSSSVDADPNNLRSDPNSCSLPKIMAMPENFTDNSNLSFDKELSELLLLEQEGKYEEVIPMYYKKFQKEITTDIKKYILIRLARCYKSSGKKDFTDFLNKEIRSNIKKDDALYAATLEAENILLIANFDYKKAADNFLLLKTSFPNIEATYKHSLFNLWSINYYQLNNEAIAKEYSDELKAKYPEDELTIHCKLQLGEIKSYSLPEISDKKELTKLNKENIEFAMLDNYPNPFNPTTTISYTLPETDDVQIKIFDVLGREVAILVDETKSAGKHSVTWNGSNYASGIYFYTITFNNQTLYKKMLMIK